MALIAGFPTAAHAKKQHKLKMDPSVPETAEPAGPVPPEADANGHVNYGNPQAEGLGRVTVKSKSGDKIQVYLEGRYFGDTPITIYSVPKGDYIVEGTIVGSGKQVTSPVSVNENEEATVELAPKVSEAPVATATGGGGGAFSGEISPRRLLLTKVCIGAAAVGLVGAIAFGILEKSEEHSWESTPASQTQQLNDIQSRGKLYAGLTDGSLVLLGVGVAGAVIFGYPMVFHATEKTDASAAPTALLTPVLAPGMTGGAFSMRF